MSIGKLTSKQQGYLAQRIAGVSQTEAARAAGYSAKSATEQATRLEKHPTIARELAIARGSVVEGAKVTLQGCYDMLQAAFNIAREKNNAGAMVGAVTALAKLAGLWIERSEDISDRERVAAEREKLREVKIAGTLLGDAAEALGLPRTATPAQIVGSLALTEIAPPQAFELLHASRRTDEEAA